MIRLDTHVVVWLYAGEIERLSSSAIEAIEQHVPHISPIVQLELAYLHEIGRLSVSGAEIVGDLSERIGLRSSDASMQAVVHAALSQSWTRDPFDRLIVADAIVAAAQLITKDQRIHEHTTFSRW
ncbi:MAG: type II toxin-antitoxin system VapC family toxin [Ilumatobacteraceae bacterium]|jgi:PIN domain nuclease of toxin-antitoxin system